MTTVITIDGELVPEAANTDAWPAVSQPPQTKTEDRDAK